jgi:ATPase subunit of ABC transporter with duplicated ATPase domains
LVVLDDFFLEYQQAVWQQLIFAGASFQLKPGEKVGPVGPNGGGKTTLIRVVVGEESPDEGNVSVPKKLSIGYFPPGRGGDERRVGSRATGKDRGQPVQLRRSDPGARLQG